MTTIHKDALLAYLEAQAEGSRVFNELLEHVKNGVFDNEVEYEYGYNGNYIPNDTRIFDTPRTPDNWHGNERPIYRRVKAQVAGEWVEYDGPITMEKDPNPWLKPGAHPDNHPRQNRSPHDMGGMEFHPRSGYEQDYEKYGFKRAKCGRTDEHPAHSTKILKYCMGVPK